MLIARKRKSPAGMPAVESLYMRLASSLAAAVPFGYLCFASASRCPICIWRVLIASFNSARAFFKSRLTL